MFIRRMDVVGKREIYYREHSYKYKAIENSCKLFLIHALSVKNNYNEIIKQKGSVTLRVGNVHRIHCFIRVWCEPANSTSIFVTPENRGIIPK